ncbi:MAG: exodeoxyribonuclease VII large subunit [Deltaproteobacteria bacterium]|nr:MAG: exodeoxyribonuclease VII large subunit [Deltaproteobacteria bacterium]
MQRPYSVGGLCAELQRLVEARYPVVLVEGEVVQANYSSVGHCYVTLGDRDARLAGIVFRGTLPRLRVRPEAGMRVLVQGRLSFYPRGGQVQLVINELAPAGEGALAKQIAERRKRLMRDGLLDPRRKRDLPRNPRTVGVVTSLTGAALQDFLKVSGLRFPAARILVAASRVQGPEAPAELIRAMDLLQEDGRSELVVITRGGGAKSDLLAFQDEYLARAVAACAVPVLSAVGHEIDTTLCDEVADAVASTPSAAAVLALPDGVAMARQADEAFFALQRAMHSRLRHRRNRLQDLAGRLRHPGEQLAARRKRLIELDERLRQAMDRMLLARRVALATEEERLHRPLPGRLRVQRQRLDALLQRLGPSVQRRLERSRSRLDRAEQGLGALSPRAVLARGYAIARDAEGRVIRRPSDVKYGDRLQVHLAEGDIDTIVS